MFNVILFIYVLCGKLFIRKIGKGVITTMISKKIINGEEYLLISDVSKACNVNTRTLWRWIESGDMVNFMTVYRSTSGIHYFRLGKPHDYDVRIENETFKYKLPEERRGV